MLKIRHEPASPQIMLGENSVIVDVGADGDDYYQTARLNPTLTVYAFEPHFRKWVNVTIERQLGVLPNYIMIPMAVAEMDGFAPFNLNGPGPGEPGGPGDSGASSLLPFAEEGFRCWEKTDPNYREKVDTKMQVLVPTIRLDTFMKVMNLTKIDFLKVDAQGYDYYVVKSAGERLKDIKRVRLEVQITPVQLYAGAKDKAEIIAFMEENGFALVGAIEQNEGREENLHFERMEGTPYLKGAKESPN